MEHRVWTVYCSFLERSVGNVRHFFWLLFRMTWARILLLFECFDGAPPWDFFVLWACRNRFAKGTGTNPMFRAASVLFRMTWARILLLFECFEGTPPWDFFVLWACRNRFAKGTGTNPMFRAASFVQLVCGFAWFGHYFFLFKWVPKATFRHFSGCGFAMAWAQNLLGFCLFACASQTPFSWVWSGGLQASKSYVAQRFALLEATFFLFLVGSKSNVSAFFFFRHFS